MSARKRRVWGVVVSVGLLLAACAVLRDDLSLFGRPDSRDFAGPLPLRVAIDLRSQFEPGERVRVEWAARDHRGQWWVVIVHELTYATDSATGVLLTRVPRGWRQEGEWGLNLVVGVSPEEYRTMKAKVPPELWGAVASLVPQRTWPPPPDTIPHAIPVGDSSASSVAVDYERGPFPPQFAFDDDPATAWAPRGLATGQWIEASFGRPVTLIQITVASGCSTGDGSNCWRLGRPRKVTFTFSDGACVSSLLRCTDDNQTILLPRGWMTQSVRMTIDSVYSSRKPARRGLPETAISELSFAGTFTEQTQ